MKLLVTGGAGFIGSNFIHYWLENRQEDEIVNFDKLTYAGNLENLKDVLEQTYHDRYSFVQGDIADAVVVAKVMRGIDVVVNFAAETHVDRSITGPAEFIQTNVVGTQVLLDEAVKAGVKRFHHISTDEVFGDVPYGSKTKFNEETPMQPSSPYSASKAASDHLVWAYFRTYGVNATITNCSNNYGPYQFPEKFMALMITNALENKALPIYGEGKNMRDWLYVEDHCAAIEAVLKSGKPGETYCVGGDAERQNLEVAKKVLAILGKPESLIEFVKDRPGHDRRYPIDSTKIKTQLGWQPGVSFDEGLKRTIDWYEQNEWWWRPLKDKNSDYYQKQYEK